MNQNLKDMILSENEQDRILAGKMLAREEYLPTQLEFNWLRYMDIRGGNISIVYRILRREMDIYTFCKYLKQYDKPNIEGLNLIGE